MAHLCFQMRAVIIFKLSPVCIRHVHITRTGFFSHMQLVWTDNSMGDPMWMDLGRAEMLLFCLAKIVAFVRIHRRIICFYTTFY